MNFFSYLGKSKDSDQKDASEHILDESDLFHDLGPRDYTRRIKRLLHADATRENLTDNEFLPYIYYDVKLHDLLYKTVFLGIGFAVFGRIMVKKLKINLTTKEQLWFDMVGFCTCYHYLHFREYPKLSDILSTRLSKEEEEELKHHREREYEKARLKLLSNYRSKFYTDSQYWH